MKEIIKLNVKPVWQASKGHQNHRNGGPMADRRTKRQKTRAAQKRAAMSD
jgi:hypothetical protein